MEKEKNNKPLNVWKVAEEEKKKAKKKNNCFGLQDDSVCIPQRTFNYTEL